MERDIDKDIRRAKGAVESAEDNLEKLKDVITAANRTFVACENAARAYIGKVTGNIPKTRARIQHHLKSLKPELKQTYDESYDLRAQADYGRAYRFLELNDENLRNTLNKVKNHYKEISKILVESDKQ